MAPNAPMATRLLVCGDLGGWPADVDRAGPPAQLGGPGEWRGKYVVELVGAKGLAPPANPPGHPIGQARSGEGQQLAGRDVENDMARRWQLVERANSMIELDFPARVSHATRERVADRLGAPLRDRP